MSQCSALVLPFPLRTSSLLVLVRRLLHLPDQRRKVKVVETLSANSKHEVLKNGVKLGKQLVETIEEEETAWKLLADFWSEMILYVAPSDNLEGHKEAIARGGELITLLWVMLFHAGIVSRPGEEDGAAATATSAGAV
ncbi:hypothetical protein HU200_016333 [Digitaria exilis]|uniref:DUF4220 domain-containing protein n=1 Tax=Digitaria exilis TaxID=1010633 RepID=A0A835KKX2_9POAL|nr:hypothetical protein HU200_016333 [Digitaria exilis]